MAHENLLYQSMIFTFLGFMVFLASILNKINQFIWVMDQYFVLFLFLGILITGFGIINMVVWNFRNRTPFFDDAAPKPKLHFVPFLGFGMMFVIGGFTTIHYIKHLSMNLYVFAMAISITGILSMLYGLKFFLKEAYAPSQKNPSHSGT